MFDPILSIFANQLGAKGARLSIFAHGTFGTSIFGRKSYPWGKL